MGSVFLAAEGGGVFGLLKSIISLAEVSFRSAIVKVLRDPIVKIQSHPNVNFVLLESQKGLNDCAILTLYLI